jgi:hypothetical protein
MDLKQLKTINSGLLNFEGTPYTVNGETQLVLFGCDDSVIIRSHDSTDQSTCTTSCNRPADFNQMDECMGLDCCRAGLPPSYYKSYGRVWRGCMQLEFAHSTNNTSDKSFKSYGRVWRGWMQWYVLYWYQLPIINWIRGIN